MAVGGSWSHLGPWQGWGWWVPHSFSKKLSGARVVSQMGSPFIVHWCLGHSHRWVGASTLHLQEVHTTQLPCPSFFVSAFTLWDLDIVT